MSLPAGNIPGVAVKVPIVKLLPFIAQMSRGQGVASCGEHGAVSVAEPELDDAPQLPPIAALVHDLRSPLSAVLGFARLAREDLAAGDSARAALLIQRLERSALTLDAILQSALEPSRTSHPANLASVVEQIRAERKCELEARGIRLQAPEDAPALAVRSADLYRLLSNLIGNAIDHMGKTPSATIAVSIVAGGERALLRVCDNGVGIAPDRREIVFDAAHSACGDDDAHRHCGLGLAIVRQLAASWGGRAWVDGTPLPGTTLCVTIPVAR